MSGFVGRERELGILARELDAVASPRDPERPGRCLVMRGRRRIGKSRLVEHFLAGAAVPSLYFTAAGGPVPADLEAFTEEAGRSSLPERDLLVAGSPRDWDAAFRLLASALPSDRPSAVVVDEVPYLMSRDPDAGYPFEGILQRVWDRVLVRKPVLLVLIGSDLPMMEALTSDGRPFHQRGRELVLGPLTPGDVARMLDLPPADAIDATLVTGGLPLLCAEWAPRQTLWGFLSTSLVDPTSPVVVSAERSLAAEFPVRLQARDVLAAVGSGERTFTGIARAAGGLASAPLQRALQALVEKRLVAAELPLSTRPSRERRYRITDPYLRFWLSFLARHVDELERGRPDLTLDRISAGWTSWRGRAVEPLVREAVLRLAPERGLPDAAAVGAYWTRTNDVEVDLVGADREPVARRLRFVGSVKWHESAPFDDRDHAELLRHRSRLTDEPLPTLAVSRRGSTASGPDAVLTPDDLLTAW